MLLLVTANLFNYLLDICFDAVDNFAEEYKDISV